MDLWHRWLWRSQLTFQWIKLCFYGMIPHPFGLHVYYLHQYQNSDSQNIDRCILRIVKYVTLDFPFIYKWHLISFYCKWNIQWIKAFLLFHILVASFRSCHSLSEVSTSRQRFTSTDSHEGEWNNQWGTMWVILCIHFMWLLTTLIWKG